MLLVYVFILYDKIYIFSSLFWNDPSRSNKTGQAQYLDTEFDHIQEKMKQWINVFMNCSLINNIRTGTIQQLCFIASWEIGDFKYQLLLI